MKTVRCNGVTKSGGKCWAPCGKLGYCKHHLGQAPKPAPEPKPAEVKP